MSFLTYIYRNGLWISIPLFVISAALLAYFSLNVIRVVKQAHLLSVPVLEQQEIEFTEAGRVVLCTQGPQLSFRFTKLDYELAGDGILVEGRKGICTVSGMGLHRKLQRSAGDHQRAKRKARKSVPGEGV